MYEVELNSDRRQDPSLQNYLQTIGRYRLLTREEERDLARRIRQGDMEAMDTLVNSNLRFVVSVAKKFLNRGLSYMDLIAEGNVGLITAAKRFDERRGFRFISYAVWWIRQAIQKALADQVHTVRLPMNRTHQVRRIKTLKKNLEQEQQREIKPEELADALNLSLKKMEQIQGASGPLVSLDQGFTDDDSTLAEILVGPGDEDPEESFLWEELRSELHEALRVLTTREREVVCRYYGLDGEEETSLETIGRDINLSRERVRQIRNHAFAKIRQTVHGDALVDFLT